MASEPNRSTTGQSVGVEGTAYESNTNSFEALSIIENNNDDPTSGGAKWSGLNITVGFEPQTMESKEFLLALVKDSEWYSDREFWNCEMELPREVMSFAPANVTVAAFVIRSQKIWWPSSIRTTRK